MMLLGYLALSPLHVKNKLSINNEVMGLVCTQMCSQVCTQRAREWGQCLSFLTLATQNSPPCCCKVRKSPQAGAGPVAGSRSPGGLQDRLQPIYAEQPGKKTEEMTRVGLGSAQVHVFSSSPREMHFRKWLVYQVI